MASEYLKWKYRDVKPDEPPPPLTGWPKFKNWLHYHLIYIIAAAVVAAVAGTMLWNVLGIGKTRPDYIFAYVGRNPLPEDTRAALSRELGALGEDVNGDGRVYVEVRSYVSGGTADPDTAMGYAQAAAVTLTADISSGESVFFITDDPLALQVGYQILADAAGALPGDDDYSVEGRAYRWSDCPALAGLDLGDYTLSAAGTETTGSGGELMSKMYIGRRGFARRGQEKYPEADAALWAKLTEGANFQQ